MKVAAQRLSTVYFPGNKITMLPENVINQYTLGEERLCPAVSMYLEVADDYTIISISSCIEQVRIAANLRHDVLEKDFNEETLAKNNINCAFGHELKLLWNFACKMEFSRGKANDSNNERIDYGFSLEDGRSYYQRKAAGFPYQQISLRIDDFCQFRIGESS